LFFTRALLHSKDEAAKAHQQRRHQIPTQDLIIYTDGSGYNRQIGAGVHSPTTSTTKGAYIGRDYTHNVYAAELTAIQMAITLFEEKSDEHTNVYIHLHKQSILNSSSLLTKTPIRTIHYQGDLRCNRQNPQS
jgi:hypothetical protein